MPVVFEATIQQVSTVTSTATLIWDTDYSAGTAYGPLGTITAGAVLKDVVITNQSTQTVYVGGATVTTATGLPIPAGGQVVLYGYNVTSVAASLTGDISAIVASGTAQVTVGLASLPAAVV